MSQKSLLDHYRLLLPIARAVATEKGMIRAVLPDGSTQAHIVRGRQMVLPTAEYIKSENGNELTFFHPFLEDGGKRVTESVEDYRSRVAVTIGLSAIALMSNLSTLASSEEHSPALNTQQIKALLPLKDLDKNAHVQIVQVLHSVMSDVEYRKSHWPVKMFISGRGESPRERDQENLHYWTTVSFPLYDEIVEELGQDAAKGGRKFAGVKISNKALRCLKELMEFVFPRLTQENWYSSGSDSDICPFMVSLLKAMQELTDAINSAIGIFDNQPGFEDIKLPVDWIDSIAAMSSLYKQIIDVPVGNNFARDRVENKGDEVALRTQAEEPTKKPRTMETLRAESGDKKAGDEIPEFIKTPRGVIRNPEFRRQAAIGSLGSLSRRNPYDPRNGDVIIPDTATFNTSTAMGRGAWGN